MTGVKGKSGGPRKNSGGARPGAGRPKKPKEEPKQISERDMLQLLQDIAFGRVDATIIQVRAAIAAIQYTHHKKTGEGKKEAAAEAAKKASQGGKFATRTAPPTLVYSKKEK